MRIIALLLPLCLSIFLSTSLRASQYTPLENGGDPKAITFHAFLSDSSEEFEGAWQATYQAALSREKWNKYNYSKQLRVAVKRLNKKNRYQSIEEWQKICSYKVFVELTKLYISQLSLEVTITEFQENEIHKRYHRTLDQNISSAFG